jgi:hypothetical protein
MNVDTYMNNWKVWEIFPKEQKIFYYNMLQMKWKKFPLGNADKYNCDAVLTLKMNRWIINVEMVDERR